MGGIGVEILGVVAVGIGMAAVLFAARHAARKAGWNPPPWLLPAGIGAAMVLYSVWNDYSWYDRAVTRLPEGTEVLMVGTARQAWAPWTFIAPVEVRFAALDPAAVTQAEGGNRRAEIMLVERRGQTLIVPQEFDCERGLIRPARGDWAPAAAADPAFAAVCGGDSLAGGGA